jgi:predicted metal-dependent peptidase
VAIVGKTEKKATPPVTYLSCNFPNFEMLDHVVDMIMMLGASPYQSTSSWESVHALVKEEILHGNFHHVERDALAKVSIWDFALSCDFNDLCIRSSHT